MVFGDLVPGEVPECQAFLRLQPFLAEVLALGGGEDRQKVVEALIAVIVPVELLVGAHQQPGRLQPQGVFAGEEIEVERGNVVIGGDLYRRAEKRI